MTTKAFIKKTATSYDKEAVGIISTNPNQVYGGDGVFADSENPRPVSMAGRVPTKVTASNGAIRTGDRVTASNIPGVAMKATQAGWVVGIALEDYSGEGIGKIITFVKPVWYDPNMNFTEDGDIVINGNQNSGYTVTAVRNNAVLTNIVSAGQFIAAKITAGLVTTKSLVVEQSGTIASLSVTNLSVAGQNIQDYIASIVRSQMNSTSPQIATGSAQIANLTTDNLSSGSASISGSLSTEAAIIDELTTTSITSTGTTSLGSLLAQTATISGTLTSENLDVSGSSRLDILEARQAQLENVRATTAELMDATVSGTLYANNIDGLQNQIALTLQQPSFLDILTGNVPETVTGDPIDVYEVASSAGYDIDSDLQATAGATLSLADGDIILNGQAAYIEKYLQVNGLAYVADSLGVGNRIVVGNTTSISDGVIAFASSAPNNTLRVQPSGQGKLDFLAGLMTLEGGTVQITGNVYVAGTTQTDTLLTNLVQPADFGNPFQVQVAGVSTESGELKQSRFEIINELGTPVATISAQGKAAFAGGIGIGSETLQGPEAATSSSVTVSANKSSGKAKLLAGTTQLIIESDQITENSLIYVTPVGSTQNQVLFVKTQIAEDQETLAKEGRFTVGVDAAISADVSFNWWIVN